MNQALVLDENAALTDPTRLPDGMIDYSARTAIRDLLRLHGDEKGLSILNLIIEDELTNRPRPWRKS